MYIHPDADVEVILHELGHAIDYTYDNKWHKNLSTVKYNPNMVSTYDNNMSDYVAAGKPLFADHNYKGELYPTANLRDMFADSYVLMINNNVTSKKILTTDLKESLAYSRVVLENIKKTQR